MKPKRVVSLLVAGCMAVSMVPASAVTAFAEEAAGTGSSITAPATVKVEVTLNGTQTLQQAVEAKNLDLASITELKVTTTGSATLTKADFQFMSGVVVTDDGSGYTAKNNPYTAMYAAEGITYLTNLEELDLSNATCPDNTIPPKAFQNNSKIKKIILPDNLEKTGVHAFSKMSNLEYLGTNSGNLNFPDSMKIMGEGMVFEDAKLTGALTLPANLEEIGSSCFYKSGVSGKVVIPGSVNIATTTTDDGPGTKTSTQIFLGTKITSLEFGFGTKEIGKNFAHGCTDLKTVVLPSTVEKIGEGAFGGTKLSSLPNLENVTEIGDGAFANIGLTGTLTLPEGVQTIGKQAFRGNQFSGTVVIPESVQSIGEGAFSYIGGGVPADTGKKVDSIIVGNPSVTLGQYAFYNQKDGVKLYFTSDTAPTNQEYWTANSTTVLVTAGGKIDTTKDVDKTTGLYTPAKDGYTFEGWYENKDFTGDAVATIDTGKTYYAKWTENASMDANADKKDDSQNATVTVGKPVEITVTVNPGDHMMDIWNGKAKATFTDPSAVESLSCYGKTYTGKELADVDYTLNVSDLMPSSSVAAQAASATAKMSVVFNKKGNQNITIQLLDSQNNLLCKSTTAVTVEEEKKPEETKKDDDTKKDDSKPENPVTTYALTVADGTVKVNGKDVAANESGAYAVEKDAKVEVTFDKTTLSDAQVFDQWTITPASVLNAVDPKSETISFTMPAEEVSIKAMTRDATIEDDGPGVLGTAAMIGVGVAGTAVLGYQGYMIGTELYLKNVLPAGAAIPTNTAELAKLVWNDAGRPEPIALLAADATDEQKALTWTVENQLISADKAADASVTRWEVIQTWNQEQEMKKA